MQDFSGFLLIGFLLVLLIGAILLLVTRKLAERKKLPYVPIPILTAAERKFFTVLEKSVPSGCYVLSQVRLANLVKVKHGTPEFWKHFSRIGMKCVDFVVVEYPAMNTLLVVELDDRSHEQEDRRQRDIFVDDVLYSAGIPILHVPTQATYKVNELSMAIKAQLQ
jgi:hypothetical protein